MLPLFAFVLPVLLLFCGLAIDVNALQNAQMRAQCAADAAATSSAQEFQSGSGAWISVGKQTAALYGLTDSGEGVTITVKQRPSDGQFSGRDNAIQVTIAQPSPTYFMRFVETATVTASAVALLPPCVVLRGAQALTLVASVLQTGCPVYSNGRGGLSGSNSWSSPGLLLGPSGNISSAPGISVGKTRNLGDPLASLTQPRASSCRANAFSQTGGTATLQPGTYCNGMTLKNATVTLASGLYVITGGAHWTGSTVRGNGVTLFFTNSSAGYGQFVVDGNSVVSLTAATTTSGAALPGLVVFGDRNWQPQSSTDFLISNATVQTTGIWYTTGTGLALSNATLSGTAYLGLDIDSLTLSSSKLQGGADFSSVATGNPFQMLGGLAE